MHLSELPAGSRVFVDANVMVYFFLQVEPFVETCRDFFADYGLLTGDSIILAVMERYKLIDLATNDPDFERVPGIRVWMPR